jgi:hypothetical protein
MYDFRSIISDNTSSGGTLTESFSNSASKNAPKRQDNINENGMQQWRVLEPFAAGLPVAGGSSMNKSSVRIGGEEKTKKEMQWRQAKQKPVLGRKPACKVSAGGKTALL